MVRLRRAEKTFSFNDFPMPGRLSVPRDNLE
jgi:hypothetical protein